VKHKDSRSSAHLEPVTVFATGDPGLLAIAKSILQSADVLFATRGEGLQNIIGVGHLSGAFNPLTGPMELQVRAEDAEDARLLLADLGA
jgi:Putative prokaryotic signal transducing protein